MLAHMSALPSGVGHPSLEIMNMQALKKSEMNAKLADTRDIHGVVQYTLNCKFGNSSSERTF